MAAARNPLRGRRATIRHLFCAVAALTICVHAAAEPTIFLVRHAEKADGNSGDPKDPPLSAAGRARAGSLAMTLKDAGITAIYATEYKRTQQTAEPLARASGIEVTVVPANKTDALVSKLKEREGAALVVGHSNTIPEILNALGASVSFTIADSDYADLFILAAAKPRDVIRLRLPASQANTAQ